ncbi:MAG: AAA family ATPase [Phycisphaerae bacterium]
MAQTVRVIVVNTDEEVAADLRAVLLGVPGIRIVAELDEPAMLGRALDQFPAEILLVHLDPNAAATMEVVAPLLEARKGQLAAIGMTENRDAELVVRAMRAGMKEFLWKPFPPEQLAAMIQRVAADSPGKNRKLGRLIPVIGMCGGVGATTIATNLAVELAQIEGWVGAPSASARPRVAVVDMDFRFGQVAMHLDCQPAYTIAELCDTTEQIDPQMIERAMCKHNTGLNVLARPAEFEQADRISPAQSASALATLQEHFDFVVADMPVRFDASAKSVLDMADLYLLVLQLLVPAVRNADRMIREIGRGGFALDRVRLICNRYGRDSGILEQGDVEATLRRKLDFLVPDEWKVASMAVNMGAPLLTHAPKSKLRSAIQKIAHTLACGEDRPIAAPADANDESRKGLFKFFAGAKS